MLMLLPPVVPEKHAIVITDQCLEAACGSKPSGNCSSRLTVLTQ